MFLSRAQVEQALDALASVHPFFGTTFLAFKKSLLPVGEIEDNVNFTAVVNEIMNRYYKPLSPHEEFYSPFETSNKNNRWQNKRYASTTLQRITVDTFGDAFLHPKSTQQWGWKTEYVNILEKHLGKKKIPIFHLAVWLFRQEVWSEYISQSSIIFNFVNQFSITDEEIETLFDISLPAPFTGWLQEDLLTDAQILEIIGYPDAAPPSRGAVLEFLELQDVGPTPHFLYEPADRLNIVTGDNSLGKTFLFDCVWWALTGEWVNGEARPRPEALLKRPRLSYGLKALGKEAGREQKIEVEYDWGRQRWKEPKKKRVEAGLAIYARFDGSFAIWDPARREIALARGDRDTFAHTLKMSRDDLWNGLQDTDRKKWPCNGLLRDWVSWQLSGPRFKREWDALKSCMKRLSPVETSLVAGEPVRVDVEDDREIPTIVMPYGVVPLTHASAGVQRALGLAYALVWTWFKHLENAEVLRQKPQHRMVIIIDEVEAHLHPLWQRVIVPAIMGAVESLSSSLAPQIHIATHSAMVMASSETIFDEDVDNFHHLRLEDREVILEELPFYKRGTADFWLMSEAFELGLPRSLPAERAIKSALKLQLEEQITAQEVERINTELKRLLGEGDEFWPRWRYFALQYDVN